MIQVVAALFKNDFFSFNFVQWNISLVELPPLEGGKKCHYVVYSTKYKYYPFLFFMYSVGKHPKYFLKLVAK